MNPFNLKMTPAQTLIFHLLISGLVSALVAGGTAAFQYISTNGFSLSEVLHLFLTAFLAAMLACYLSIKNNPNFVPALFDSLNELKTLVNQAPAIGTPTAPLVVVHAAQTQAETAGTPPAGQAPPPQQSSSLQVSAPPESVQVAPPTAYLPGWNATNAPPQTMVANLAPPSSNVPQFQQPQQFQRNWDTTQVPAVGQTPQQ